ncbi:MAG: formate--tetrahydrofolate ligase [Firmicutes bacterium]|nr:formate--tetrahydrofolate ligase [Bacillota bacterium]
MKTDIEIAQACKMANIRDIAAGLGVEDEYFEPYGYYKAKIHYRYLQDMRDLPSGKLILVTAMTPTPMGEGKTTVSIGLADALRKTGKKSMVALRQPSLGPVFGVKGGAAGGGYAQVVPMEDINLHFTGDFHGVASANNLLAAMVDNHIYQGNALGLDVRRIAWRRCVDMNDRQLRHIACGLGGLTGGIPREDGFDITAASEVMAVLCLAEDLTDLKKRLSRMIVGYTRDGAAITAGQLQAAGAMAVLLKDALKPNLVQTLEGTPALIHGGPFANIAHGCNSVIATKMALKLADYTVTEAGFGADLGAEKFLDIKCRMSGLRPDAVVLVATLRALKHHGGLSKAESTGENRGALAKGLPNLLRHIENLRTVYHLSPLVAINRFAGDSPEELDWLRSRCEEAGVEAAICDVRSQGGAGGLEMAEKAAALCEKKNDFCFCYDLDLPLEEKLTQLARKIYGADGIDLSDQAKKQIDHLNALGFQHLPICVAKTQYSFSDDKNKLAAPSGFRIFVSQVKAAAGAGFVIALTGDIMTMPGLPKKPAAESIDIGVDGMVSGLF